MSPRRWLPSTPWSSGGAAVSETWPTPLDSEVWAIRDGLGGRLITHSIRQCAQAPCVLHSPTDHPMRTWPMVWRPDRDLFERGCPHGIGHPDPDSVTWLASQGDTSAGLHGCDSCCADVA